MTKFRNLSLLFLMTLIFPFLGAHADLRTPTWWDPDGVGVGQDWHYRIPVTLAGEASIDNMAVVNVNFGAALAGMDVSGAFDIRSIRVIDPNGVLVPVQEYTDAVFNGATDPLNDAKGEIRWIVQTNGVATYYIYFDITQNGAKPVAAITPINGNFEHTATPGVPPTPGAQQPFLWEASTGAGGASYDHQIRPNESVSVRTNGTTIGSNSRTTNGNANSGNFSFLLGARTNDEVPSGVTSDDGTITLKRTMRISALNPGFLTVRYKIQGWGGAVLNNSVAGDYASVRVTNDFGLGPDAGFTYTSRPFSPNLGLTMANGFQSGTGHYNGFDNRSTGVNSGTGGTIAFQSDIYRTVSIDLAPLAGGIGTFIFNTNHFDINHKTWVLVDDVEWGRTDGTLGTAEAFGANIIDPAGGLALTNGQALPPITASVDARPIGTTPVTANLYDDTGMLRSSSPLFNDGAHGDGGPNDAIWGNNGTDTANPLPRVPTNVTTPGLWTLRIFARDNSTSSLGTANNGLVHRNGLGNEPTQTNYWNIDQRLLTVIPPDVRVTKTSTVISDPISSSNFKNIPGAVVQYCMTIRNNGLEVTNIVATDILPSDVSYRPNSMRSGASCGTAATVEDDDATDGGEVDGITASYNAGAATVTVNRPTLASSTEFAVTFEVQVN